jgi:hypothetical protein
MNASTGKTLGIILLVLLGLMLLWPLKLLFLAPAGVFNGIFHGTPFHFDRIHFGAWPWIGFAGVFGLAVLALGIAILIWVYNDAEKRGLSGVLWAILVFFLHVLGFIIYLVVRSSHPEKARPAGVPATGPTPPPAPAPGPIPIPPAPGPSMAPPAPAPQPAACPQCGKPVAPAHAYCPTCGTKQ